MLYHDEDGEETIVSIPRGGPLYVPNMIGPVTRVSNFETSVFQELQSLQNELSSDSLETWDDEIRVGELKIMTEDEFVSKAFEIAFEGEKFAENGSQVREDHLSHRDESNGSGSDVCLQNSERDLQQAVVPSENLVLGPLRTCNKKKSNEKSSKKRMHKSTSIDSVEENYLAKVEELARIREQQQGSVRLHSFKSHELGGTSVKSDKVKCLKSANVSTKVRASNTPHNVPAGYPETILCFEVYHRRKQWIKTQEFLVLGRQFLTEVKDKISCSTDDIMKKAGQYDPSGYFLIEDAFCNDMRAQNAVDYSKPILDWLKNSKSDAHEKWEYIIAGEMRQKRTAFLDSDKKEPLPTFKALHMQSTRFCDIKFRVGAGYSYCHQGDCKHLIVIRDMRLIHPDDLQNRAAYPLVTFQLKIRHQKCSICRIYWAQKVTVDDKWAELNPCYFCDVCYYMLHYENGALLYNDFSVYDYHHE